MKQTFLEIRHLKTLVALKEAGSVSEAANNIFLTQSALSHQIKSIEAYFGLSLFERKTQPIQFTSAGERLIRLAYQIIPQVIDAELDMTKLKEGYAGELRIAVECHTCFDWLMPAMDQFRKKWPMVELDIVSGFHTDARGLLLTHRADWAIVADDEETDGIVHLPLFAYEMVGICSVDHPLATKRVWSAADFADETLITYPVPDDMLDLLRKVLIPSGISPERRNSELTIAIIQLVASRRGISALPYWAILPYLDRGYVVARKITEQGLYSTLYAAVREGDATVQHVEDFYKIVKNQTFSYLPELSII